MITQNNRKQARKHRRTGLRPGNGFTLVVTVMMMVMLAMVAIGLLSLSEISLRSASLGVAQAEARTNARLALALALGELQKQMGPDMRISAEAAIFDENEESEAIDGVDQSRWLGCWDSWGSWLNAEYTRPDGGSSLTIQDTYTAQREKMFRGWLVSLPEDMRDNVDAPLAASSTWNSTNSALMVGAGTLGDSATTYPDRVTRAPLVTVSSGGKHAWWIGPENHKAKVNLSGQERDLDDSEWEVSQGNTAEVGVGALDGLDALDDDSDLAEKIITLETLGVAQADEDKVGEHFFDLTATSQGVLASVRTGHLKKDLSLLFENDSNDLPDLYAFNEGSAIREPSIRPMSSDLSSNQPKIANRHFQSWTNMRHFYRMYRRSSDATVGEISGEGNLEWSGSKPYTEYVASTDLGTNVNGAWNGSNNYWRAPILAKITFIYSLLAEPSATERGKYDCYHVYSPVFTYWNPYNVEMRVPDNTIELLTSAYKVWPNSGEFWLGDTLEKDADEMGAFGQFGYSEGVNTRSMLRSGNGRDIIFEPGEFKIFSHQGEITSSSTSDGAGMFPGFDPSAIGGEKKYYGTYSSSDNPGVTIQFSHNYWGGNVNYGNTCGSLCMISWYDRDKTPGAIPINYAIDWLNKDQRTTPMIPSGLSNVSRWIFDGEPNPVAFTQLVIKGLSEFDYESIRWEKDWRSRNWIQAPPYYFGSGLYISEDDTIAHTQRLDCPYAVYFGPMTSSEMPKVVAQIDENSLLGSGSNPAEQITAAPMLELPTAPISSLAGFANMRINPGWLDAGELGSHLKENIYTGSGVTGSGGESLYAAETKRVAYQSGITGPGIGNSFMHPMLPRTGVYRYLDNSRSQDIPDRSQPENTDENDTMAYNDYWDHVFLLNDALWDDYFVSSLADQSRTGASSAYSLTENLQRLLDGESLSNSRYIHHSSGQSDAEVLAELKAEDGYLKAAKHLVVDGMFNVNSTSVSAWFSLFAGIRERQLVARNASGSLETVSIPSGKRIAISRLNTAASDQEMDDPESGITFDNGNLGWSGVRFLDNDQLQKLAEECVKQVKQRGPFLNYSEFINRRLSNDSLGLMGALQSAIDYDDDNPESDSINYRFKGGPDYMISTSDLGTNSFSTPEAAAGSRFAGIPGYVIQSDLLKPISNTLSVRDDTFRIRAYGEANDGQGNVTARVWCEAIVQRSPEYCDTSDEADEPSREMDSNGNFVDSGELTEANQLFGRKFDIVSFRWLSADEV
ncbi:MAG: hypothetical protein Q7R22_002495 [Verrucomicrobiota bacterium JB025]|nr:hypothetical protein [Verrucomicrobiota bacterium JB025]